MIAMRVIIDTNILTYLLEADLLRGFLALPFEIHTADFVIGQIENQALKRVVSDLVTNDCLIVDSILSEEMPELLKLMDGNISVSDCSVWYLAKKFGCLMLTGDRELRRRAEDDGVQACSALFAFDLLVENTTIPMTDVGEKLEIIRRSNNVKDVEDRVRRWIELTNNKLGYERLFTQFV